MSNHRGVRLLTAVVLLIVSACSDAQDVAHGPTAAATERTTPSTSSAQVVVEEPDDGVLAIRDLSAAIADGDAATAWAMLGPRTRAAVGSQRDLPQLGAVLEPLVADRMPFDDVIVDRTPREQINLVVLGDRDTPRPVAGSVTTTGGRVVVELSPPAPSDVTFDVADRKRISIATPPSADVELVVDGFHFHPSQASEGRPAVMTLPYPMSASAHVLGAWYRTADGTTGIGTTTVAAGRRS